MKDGRRHLRIVVFDDSPADVYLLREALGEHGIAFDLQVFSDGAQVHEYLASARTQVDLFIIDLNLPKITGDEILAEIRKDKTLAKVPALVLTSSDSSEDREQAMRLGASAFLCKPCTLDEYLAIGKVIASLVMTGQPAAAPGRNGEASGTPSGSRA
jgi:CheY-like chemotaxis protein